MLITLCHRVILKLFINYIRVRKITSSYGEVSSLDHRPTNHPLLHNCVYCIYSCKIYFLSPDDSEAADLWLLNSCTVKNPSEDNFRNAIKRAQELDKHLVVAGCVPQGQPKHQSIKGISVIGVGLCVLHVCVLCEC